jgi:tetratricopeptide (TPR) repeat protein
MAANTKTFSLDAVRTDGWFERIGEGIGSFDALCEIVGARFFAFSIIVGARITALTVDRRSPHYTFVDFVVGTPENDGDLEPQRLNLVDFRRRLATALLGDEDKTGAPPPQRESEVEATQLFLGVRYLLLAPIFGYSLRHLELRGTEAVLILTTEDGEEEIELEEFRSRVRIHVQEELERASQSQKNAIDLSKVGEAETAAEKKDWARVVALLGSWPPPLAVFLRTPEGQMLGADTRALIARGLGLLGSACVHLGEVDQAEEVFRVGIQYAQEGLAAADLFRRLGEALLLCGRHGEAIGPLRRALAFGGDYTDVMPLLAQAFVARGRHVAAWACLKQAIDAGLDEKTVSETVAKISDALGPAFEPWKAETLRPRA